MAMKALSLLVILSLFGVSAAFGGRKALAPSPDDADIEVGAVAPSPFPSDLGFTFLNTKDPKVLDLAKFALEEYNKSHNAGLVMYSVMEATAADRDGGVDYGLVVATVKDNILSSYIISVFVSNDVKKLVSFEEGQ